MNCDVSKATEVLENELWRRWSDRKVGEWTELIDIDIYSRAHSPNFHHFTYVTTHSPTLPSLYPRHNSFSNLSIASPTSQLILQPFPRFTYVTTHSRTLPFLHLHHSSFSNPSLALTTSQLILQPFRCFTYVTTHSDSKLSVTSPTSHLIFQPFFLFFYVTGSSLTSLCEPPVIKLKLLLLYETYIMGVSQ